MVTVEGHVCCRIIVSCLCGQGVNVLVRSRVAGQVRLGKVKQVQEGF